MRKWRLSLFGAKRLTAFMLSFAMLALLTLPLTAYAAKDRGKVVRVGWYESPFNTTDASGQRDGYAYVYQQKIAAYTGWTYEYVEGSWPDLLQMLIDGKIDLMSDVSYTEERAELMQFSSLQMGAEEYYLYIAPGNNDITLNDYSTFNGKKVGVNANSYQKGLYEEWAATHELETEIVELTGGEEDLLQKLTSGEIDALVTLDVYGDPNRAIPLCKIGSSDFYFAVRNDRGDLLSELDSAMNRIISDDRNYNQELYEKYFSSIGTNLFLSDVEKTWLASHGTVKVGYMKDYLPFCAKDPETRQLTGALKEYLEYAAGAIQNADLKFDAIAFDTIGEAIEALKAGQVNCVFPANFGEADAEEMGLIITPSVMSAEIYEIVREDDLQDFGKKRNVKVAVDEGNVNYEKVLSEKFPDFEVVHYRNIKSCLQAVADGKADTVLVSNFRYNNLTKQCDKLGLTPIATGIGMGNAFVAVRGDIELYSLLNKTVNMVPASKTNSVMTLYISEKEEELTFTEFVMKHLAEVMGIVAGVLLVILALSMRTIRAMKRARRDEKLIASAETDQLTGVYSKNFLFEYARRMQNKHKNKPMDAIVVDIERFHSINTLNGQEAGDQVLRTLGEVLRTVFNDKNTIVGRIDANRFCIFRWNKWNDHDYADFLNQLQTGLEEKNPNLKLRLRMGVFPAQTGREPEKMYDRARIASNIARGQYNKVPLVVYDEEVKKKRLYDQRLIHDLNRAVQNQEFEVYYQPQYDIQATPPKLKSAEALVRWRHPELGMIFPGDFVPLFEEHGLIGEVDKCVWKQAARQVAAWRSKFGTLVPVSVNLSRVDIFDPQLESTLEGLLRENRLDHNAIKLEVTESAYTEDADSVLRVVGSLREKGFEIELDDFGTGYSSLGMLSSMPIDILKVDRSFIVNMSKQQKDIQLVKLILDLAKEMNLAVIAEGVENHVELQLLQKMGCDIVQGYYFSKPLPAAEFERLLKEELEKRFNNATL